MAMRPTKPKPKSKTPQRAKPGPKPDVLNLDGNWQDNVRKSFAKKRPATGWPKE
jgi:hypothetical protein